MCLRKFVSAKSATNSMLRAYENLEETKGDVVVLLPRLLPLPFLLPPTSLASFTRFSTNMTIPSKEIPKSQYTSISTDRGERFAIAPPLPTHEDHVSKSYLRENNKLEHDVDPNVTSN